MSSATNNSQAAFILNLNFVVDFSSTPRSARIRMTADILALCWGDIEHMTAKMCADIAISNRATMNDTRSSRAWPM